MPHTQTALQTIIDRSFSGKITALAHSADMHGPEIGRLLRVEAPLTGEKLAKLLSAEGMSDDDKHLLTQSAVRDYVGEEAYRTWFVQPQSESAVRETLGGPSFSGLFPLSPRAEQVITYIVNHAHEADITTALELLGRFLELPEPLERDQHPTPLPTRQDVCYDAPKRKRGGSIAGGEQRKAASKHEEP